MHVVTIPRAEIGSGLQLSVAKTCSAKRESKQSHANMEFPM